MVRPLKPQAMIVVLNSLSCLQYQSSPRKLDPLAPYSISPLSRSRYDSNTNIPNRAHQILVLQLLGLMWNMHHFSYVRNIEVCSVWNMMLCRMQPVGGNVYEFTIPYYLCPTVAKMNILWLPFWPYLLGHYQYTSVDLAPFC